MLDLWFLEPEQFEDSKLKVLLLALKYSRSPDVLNALPQIIRISEKVQNPQNSDYDYLKVLLLYLVSVINKGLTDRFWDIVAREHSGGEAYMKTIADVFREEERLKREKIERNLRKEIEQKDSVIKQEMAKFKQEEELVHQIVRRLIKKDLNYEFLNTLLVLPNIMSFQGSRLTLKHPLLPIANTKTVRVFPDLLFLLFVRGTVARMVLSSLGREDSINDPIFFPFDIRDSFFDIHS